MRIFFAGAHPGSNTHALGKYFYEQGYDVDYNNNGEVYDITITTNARMLDGVKAKFRVNTQHGNLFLGDSSPEYQYKIDLVLAASQSEHDMMVRNGYKSENIIISGQPRMDTLWSLWKDKGSVREKYLRSVKLDPRKQTVLYAPTYSRELLGFGNKLFFANSLNQEDDRRMAQALVESCEKYNYNLIIRLHKYLKRTYGPGLIPEYLKEYFTNAHVCDNESEPDSTGCLVSTDALITDFSSITADFLPIGNNIFFIEPNKHWQYTNKWHASKEDRISMGDIIDGHNRLEAQLKICTNSRRIIKEAIKKFQPYFDGRCCERAFRGIIAAYESRILGK